MNVHEKRKRLQNLGGKSVIYFGLLQLGLGIVVFIIEGGPGVLPLGLLGMLLISTGATARQGRVRGMVISLILSVLWLAPLILWSIGYADPGKDASGPHADPLALERLPTFWIYVILTETWAFVNSVLMVACLAASIERTEGGPQ